MPRENNAERPAGRDPSFWTGSQSEQDRLPAVTVDHELNRAEAAVGDGHDIAAHASEVAKQYREAAERLLVGISSSLRFYYDPQVGAEEGRSPRQLTISGFEPELSRALADQIGWELSPMDLIIGLGPSMVAWDGSPAEFDEVVASDLAYYVASLFPIQCTGNLADMMPWLMQLAASIAIHRTGDHEFVERCAARSFAGLASIHAGSWNATGQTATQYPAWFPLADLVSNETQTRAKLAPEALDLVELANLVRDAIAHTLVNIGIPVETRSQEATDSIPPTLN
ncbi:conserved hypothetical protein [Hyphomicrobiales bacterium]|nr:conserved hypothetical protein [Hyphomicrobiales bacterium]CAH1702381.1 conserved hypothetical protein [Hyphomicrobiales bacterium]CAI0346581.1 conserved hypothetical protein [Hyphomicrobiales bacterium]